ncbi:MAG: sulfotransferase, partial [Pseudomonadota bacterium]
MQLIVLGMHRSGTSCVSRLLNMMGAYFAPEGMIMSPQEDNPKGFWERKDVMDLNDEILRLGGGAWDQISGLDFCGLSDEQRLGISRKVQQILIGLDAHRPWCIKDPRMCLTFPFWRSLLEVPVVVFVYRNPIQVARSLEKRNGIPLHVGIALWEHYLVSALNNTHGIPRIIIRYEDVLESPLEEVVKLGEYLQVEGVSGLRCPTEKEVTAFVTKDLFHACHDISEIGSCLNQAQLSLIHLFENNAIIAGTESFDISLLSHDILKTYSVYHHNIGSVKNELTDVRAKLAGACDERDNVRAELDQRSEELAGFKQQLPESEARRAALEGDLASVRVELASLLSERDNLQKESAERLAAIAELESTLAGACDERENVRAELDRRSEELAGFRRQLPESEARRAALEGNLASVRVELASLLSERDNLQKESAERLAAIAELESTLAGACDERENV